MLNGGVIGFESVQNQTYYALVVKTGRDVVAGLKSKQYKHQLVLADVGVELPSLEQILPAPVAQPLAVEDAPAPIRRTRGKATTGESSDDEAGAMQVAVPVEPIADVEALGGEAGGDTDE